MFPRLEVNSTASILVLSHMMTVGFLVSSHMIGTSLLVLRGSRLSTIRGTYRVTDEIFFWQNFSFDIVSFSSVHPYQAICGHRFVQYDDVWTCLRKFQTFVVREFSIDSINRIVRCLSSQFVYGNIRHFLFFDTRNENRITWGTQCCEEVCLTFPLESRFHLQEVFLRRRICNPIRIQHEKMKSVHRWGFFIIFAIWYEYELLRNDLDLTSRIRFDNVDPKKTQTEFCPFHSSNSLFIGQRSSWQADREIKRKIS